MEEKVLQTIQNYHLIEKKDRIVVGVSGGPDSITLLNILLSFQEEMELQLFVAHINHGIRKEAIQDQKMVETFCQERNLPFFVKQVDIQKIAQEKKISTEAAGREERYRFFEEIYQEKRANRIATAHTANDNAETILMNIMRGTGISGLKGIEPIRDGKYIRPLITCTRKEIEAYVLEKKLNPCIDQTNFENIYTRNKIRNQLIPMMEKEFNPNLISTLNRLASLAQEEDEYWKKVIPEEYEKLVEEEKQDRKGNRISLNLKGFQKLEPFLQSKIILYAIKKACGTTQRIEKIHIEDIRRMCQKNIGNKRLTPYQGLMVEVKEKRINVITMS